MSNSVFFLLPTLRFHSIIETLSKKIQYIFLYSVSVVFTLKYSKIYNILLNFAGFSYLCFNKIVKVNFLDKINFLKDQVWKWYLCNKDGLHSHKHLDRQVLTICASAFSLGKALKRTSKVSSVTPNLRASST